MVREAVTLMLTTLLLATPFGCGTSMTTVQTRKKSPETDRRAVRDSSTAVEVVPQADLDKGISLYQSGDYHGSETTLLLAADKEPANWQIQQYLGLVRMKLGQYQQARRNFLRSLDLAPDDSRSRADLYAGLGECWENLNNVGRARLNYHTALNLWPQCSPARDGLARLGHVSESKSK